MAWVVIPVAILMPYRVPTVKSVIPEMVTTWAAPAAVCDPGMTVAPSIATPVVLTVGEADTVNPAGNVTCMLASVATVVGRMSMRTLVAVEAFIRSNRTVAL